MQSSGTTTPWAYLAGFAFIILLWLIGCATILPPLNVTRPQKVVFGPGEDPEDWFWFLDKDLSVPVSATYDGVADAVYIINRAGGPSEKNGKGFIQKVSINGRVLEEKWAVGLNAPEYGRIANGILWVSEPDSVVAFKVKTTQNFRDRELVRRWPVPGAQRLAGLDILWNGDVLVADTFGNKIYQIHKGKPSVLVEGPQLESPTALFLNKDKLYVVGSDLHVEGKLDPDHAEKKGHLFSISLISKRRKFLADNGFGNLRGIEEDGEGNLVVADEASGTISRVSPEGEAVILVKTHGDLSGMAFDKEKRRLFVAIPGENLMKAYDYKSLVADAFHLERPVPSPLPTAKPRPSPSPTDPEASPTPLGEAPDEPPEDPGKPAPAAF